MIQIIALIDVKDPALFRKYEIEAVCIMKRYGGSLLVAFEPNENESVEVNCSEVHCLEFPDLNSFKSYRKDYRLGEMAELREKAISKIKIIVSDRVKSYES